MASFHNLQRTEGDIETNMAPANEDQQSVGVKS